MKDILRLAAVALLFPLATAAAQTPADPLPTPAQTPADPSAPHGQVIIQSHGDPPTNGTQSDAPAEDLRSVQEGAKVDVSDAERSALTITSYDLDTRLNPARSGLSSRVHLTVRNHSADPLKQIALQISSTLHWDNAALVLADRRLPLTIAQHRLDTDIDHTGAETEAILPLPEPLAPGASATLDLFYSGTIAQNGGRLARLGADAQQQETTDWDGISSGWTALRGFGNVLWYPVASPQLFLADGNTLFSALGQTRLRGQTATVHLRLNVEYQGEPPAAAYFCGRREALKGIADTPDAAISVGSGIATAEFAPEALGFRSLSLFVIQHQEILLGGAAAAARSDDTQAFSSSNPQTPPDSTVLHTRPQPEKPSEAASGTPFIALSSVDPGVTAGLGAAANRASAVLADWLGPNPLSALTVIDHRGQPFEDGPLLVAPAATLETSPEAGALVFSLSHAWVQTGQPWMDEGLAQFFKLLWTEREHGREAAESELAELMQPVTLAEPDLNSAQDNPQGQPVIHASSDLFYRRKSAAVWWMLRDLAGDTPLRAALSAWRTQPASQDPPEAQAVAFQHLLERLSHKDLGWFFADWVLRDRGLPDLSILDVQTSPTPATPGHKTGWLVAITVRNEGGATADVPLITRSGSFSTTGRIRIAGFSQTTERVLVEAPPTQITVNDGSVPEPRSSTHTRDLSLHTQ